MYSSLTTVILLSAIFTTSLAATNFTVPDDHSSIKYEGSVRHVPFCQRDPSGNLPPEPRRCFDIPARCAESASIGQGETDAASLKFKGSAVYIRSLVFRAGPLYSVTLDGKSVDVDDVRPDTQNFNCVILFSRTGLDPNVEHDIRLSIRYVDPTVNQTMGLPHDYFLFSLINFMITTDNPTSVLPPGPPKESIPKSSGSNIEIPRLTTVLSLALLPFH